MDFFKNDLLFSAERVAYIVMFFALTLLLGYIILHIIARKQKLTIYTYIKFEEYVASILFAIICYNLFYLPFASLLWIVLYVVFYMIEKKSHTLYCFCKDYEKNKIKNNKSQSKTFKALTNEIYRIEKGNGIIKSVQCNKKILYAQIAEIDYKIPKTLKHLFLSLKIYFVGLLVPLLNSFLFGIQYGSQESPWLQLLEAWILFSALLYSLYHILYFLCVRNEVNLLFLQRKLFRTIFFLFSAICYLVLAMISLR